MLDCNGKPSPWTVVLIRLDPCSGMLGLVLLISIKNVTGSSLASSYYGLPPVKEVVIHFDGLMKIILGCMKQCVYIEF